MIEVSIYSLAKDEQSSLSVLNLNIALSEMLFNIEIPCLLQLSTISNHLKDLPPVKYYLHYNYKSYKININN